jgi:hypothetical protein
MPDLNAVFSRIRSMLATYVSKLDAKQDEPTVLYMDTKFIQKNKKPLFFAAVQMKNSYVSFHLMPVYLKPELLENISKSLRDRMQGKSCFNFVEVDEALFKELASLTKAGFRSYQDQGFV